MVNPLPRASSTASAASRDLPIPGCPHTSTPPPRPDSAAAIASASTANSVSRPTSGVLDAGPRGTARSGLSWGGSTRPATTVSMSQPPGEQTNGSYCSPSASRREFSPRVREAQTARLIHPCESRAEFPSFAARRVTHGAKSGVIGAFGHCRGYSAQPAGATWRATVHPLGRVSHGRPRGKLTRTAAARGRKAPAAFPRPAAAVFLVCQPCRARGIVVHSGPQIPRPRITRRRWHRGP